MPGTTHASTSSTDTPTPTGVRDDVDLDRNVWFGGGDAYHRATDWGPACVDQIGRLDEHTLGDAADEGKRPCKNCEPVDYRRVATDGGRDVLTHDGTALGLPDDVDLSDGLVIRARGVTVDHKPGSPDHDAYPLSADHLDADENLRNEQLDDFEVSLKPYGGEARTYDVEIVATDGGVAVDDTYVRGVHDRETGLESALDYASEAVARAEQLDVDDVHAARVRLAEECLRVAVYATDAGEGLSRDLAIDDATHHLETVVDELADVDVTHPARHALQMLVAREELRRPDPTPEPAPAPSPSTSSSTSGFTFLKKTTAGTLSVLTGVFAGLSLANADFVSTVETSAGDAIVTSSPGTAFWAAVGLMTVSTLLVAYATTGGRR